MTRADEIADEFATPDQRRPQPRREAEPEAEDPGVEAASERTSATHASGSPLGLPHLHLPRAPHDADAAVGSSPGAEPESAPTPADATDAPAGRTGAVSPAREPRPGAVERERSTVPVPQPQHETLPGIARAAAGGLLQAAGWTAGTSLRVSNQLRRIAADPGQAQEVIDEVTREVREVARDFLGITELDAEVREMAPLLSSGLLKAGGSSPAALRAQGEALLRAAADVGFDESAHPAFARILTELSPDEARILRLLTVEGPQPMVDVRASNLIGNGSQLIAQSLNMLGPKAGLRQRDRVPVYLTNLVRLSLVLLSDEPLERPVEYQVLEAQPEVLATLRDTARAKTVRRCILLTPLGQEFCQVCLPAPPQLGPGTSPED